MFEVRVGIYVIYFSKACVQNIDESHLGFILTTYTFGIVDDKLYFLAG
jgi:uncharacterized membrane protein